MLLHSDRSGENLPAVLGGRPVRPEGPPGWPFSREDVRQVLERAGRDGSWGRYHGPHVTRLTQRLAQMLECEFVVPCASGTLAIELALRGVGVGAGDEVLLAAYDFKGNFQDVLALGAIPVLVDIRDDNATLDPGGLKHAVSPRTKAILVSHLHGGLAAMPEIREFASSHQLAVIEDAAQVPGAVVQGRPAGRWGDVGVYSFGGSKLLSAGRGGAVFTSRADIAQRIKLYTQRGNELAPLSELQAAVLVPQCETLALDHAHRLRMAHRLRGVLSEFAGLRPFSLPANESSTFSSEPAYYKFGCWFDPAAWQGLTRDEFATAMRAEGMAWDSGFRALHKIHSARRFRAIGELPVATRADGALLTLHHPILLGDEAELLQMEQALRKVRHHAAEIHASGRARC